MLDTRIGAAAKLLVFSDDAVIKPGSLCTILGEVADGLGGVLIEVVFIDGVKRFVKPEDVRES